MIAGVGTPTKTSRMHPVNLSVNLNKVALLRNTRHLDLPSVIWSAETCIYAGAQGLTVHPRPDERHIRPQDTRDIAALLKSHPDVEYNIEGNPFLPPFMELVRETCPTQCTLVPDSPETFTSNEGWSMSDENCAKLEPLIQEMRDLGCRVSLFMDAGTTELNRVKEVGAQRIELYTEPYAQAFATNQEDQVFESFAATAGEAGRLGLGVNAGHDLNLKNLRRFAGIPGLQEVSIGHALVADALRYGLHETTRMYLAVLGRA